MKHYRLTHFLLTLLFAQGTALFAHDFETGGIFYAFNGDGTVRVTSDGNGNQRYAGDIVIPATVTHDGTTYPVTSIGYQAFAWCDTLTSIKIPDNVTTISESAFYKCTRLKSVEIGCGITNVKDDAFLSCDSLEYLSLNSPHIKSWFSNKSSIREIALGDSVRSLDYNAFYNCNGLKKINIPLHVNFIHSDAFYGCPIEELSLNCRNVGTWFRDKASIRTVTLGDSVRSLGYRAFSDCIKLTAIRIPGNVASIGQSAFSDCAALESVEMAEGVRLIGDGAFSNCGRLSRLHLPASLDSIGASAFIKCSSLTSLCLPDSTAYIGAAAFSTCRGLVSASLGRCLGEIPESAFNYCTALKTVEIPDSVTSVGRTAFFGCGQLTAVELPDNVRWIADGAFSRCTSLRYVSIGRHLQSTGELPFDECTRLDSVRINQPVPPALHVSGLTLHARTLEVPVGATVDYAADPYWGEIECIYALDGTTRKYPVLQPVAEDGDTLLSVAEGKGIELGENEQATVAVIRPDAAAHSLMMLRDADISAAVCQGDYRFSPLPRHRDNLIHTYSYPLTDVTLPTSGSLTDRIPLEEAENIYSLKIRGKINGTDLLFIRKMKNLKLLDLKEASIVSGGMNYYEDYHSENDIIGDYTFTDNWQLLSIRFPENITAIGKFACKGISLRAVTIPNQVTSIGYRAFDNCVQLTSVRLGSSVTLIDEYAFNSCPLTAISFPAALTTIGDGAFQNCSRLASVEFPASVTSLGKNAFFNCDGLTAVISRNTTPPEIRHFDNEWTFDTPTAERATLYVPAGCRTLYWLHPYWGRFANIVESDLAGIGDIPADGAESRPNNDRSVYTLDGKKVAEDGRYHHLPAGIYIIGGRKVLLK